MRRLAHLTPAMFEKHRLAADDDAPVLNAMFAEAAAGSIPGRLVYWGDSYRTRSTVYVRGTDATHVVGRIVPQGAMDAAVEVDALRSTFTGYLRVAAGPLRYTDRTVGMGVRLWASSGCRFDGFDVSGCLGSAVRAHPDGSQIDVSLGTIRAVDCGSPGGAVGPTHPAARVVAFTDRTDTGLSLSPSQRSELDVAAGHGIEAGDIAVIDGRPYSVHDAGVDYVSLFPWLVGADTAGALEVAAGSALDVRGGDVAGLTVGRIQAVRCGIGLRSAGLYGPVVVGMTAEACGIGLQVGGRRDAAHLGGFLGSAHIEACAFDALRVTSAPGMFSVGCLTIFDPAALVRLAPRSGVDSHPPQWTPTDGLAVLGRDAADYVLP